MSRKRRPQRDARSERTRARLGSGGAEAAARAGAADAGAGDRQRYRRLAAAAVATVLLATALAFAPVLANGYQNWDDPDVLVRNPALDAPGVVGWAFTTTHMGHYQPLSWLVWAAARRVLGEGARVAHGLSLGIHLLNAVLVLLLAWGLARGATRLATAGARASVGVTAALLYALHPLRVEPVAWASALPYLLALAPLLVATLAYLRHAATTGGSRTWLVTSIVLYGLSVLARPLAPGFFLVLLLLDAGLGRPEAARSEGWSPALLLEKVPYAVLGVSGAVLEASARRFVDLERVGVAERLAAAAGAPFIYVARTLWPLQLTPLDPLPLTATAPWARLGLAVLGLALLCVAAARTWRRQRAGWLALAAYAVLLAPASGLAPSGLQATADRYTYAPAVPLSLLLAGGGAVVARWLATRMGAALSPAALVLAGAVATAWGALSYRQAHVWRDSITLWSHAVAIDPRNDVALYNLATALAEQGDERGAAARYREVLALVPDHGPARKNLALLEARDRERRGNEAAAAGRLDQAERLYAEALARDPARLHSRASRGMALAQLGRCAEAIPELRTALGGGRDEPPLWGALAYCQSAVGDPAAARATLDQALERHPNDPQLEATRNALGAKIRR